MKRCNNITALFNCRRNTKTRGQLALSKRCISHGTRFKLSIIPIYFEGTELNEGGSLFTKAGSITAHVFSPISTDRWKEATLEKNIEDIRNKYIQWSQGL